MINVQPHFCFVWPKYRPGGTCVLSRKKNYLSPLFRVRMHLESTWKSLNFKMKFQGLKSPWKLQSVLESPWNLLPFYPTKLLKCLRRNLPHSLLWASDVALKNGKMCPWKALKSPWIFSRKKCTNPVYCQYCIALHCIVESYQCL